MTMNFTRGLSNWTQGTASVANGSRTVTFSGANLIANDPSNSAVQIYVAGEGDEFIVDGVGSATIASVDSATQVTLDAPWAYASQTAVAYKIRRYNEVKTGEVAKYIQSAQTMGQDANPWVSATIDDSVARAKLRETGGNIELAVGPTGTADGSLKAGLRIDPATGYVTFPLGAKDNAPGFRNRLINGGFDVWQRGTSFSVADSTGPDIVDRWRLWNGLGVAATVSRVAAPAGFRGQQALNVVANGVADGKNVNIFQRFEARTVYDLDAKPVVVSFDINATTSAGILTGYVQIATNTAVDNGSFSAYTAATAFTVPVGSGRVSAPLTAVQTAGLKNGGQVVFAFTHNGATGNINISIGSVQFEVDPSGAGKANDFEFRPLPVELAMCQRYAQIIGSGAVGKATTSSTWQGSAQFKAPMRATPTLSLLTTTIVGSETGVSGRASSGSTLSTYSVGPTAASDIGLSGWSSLTPGNFMTLATDCILASAEL